MSDDALLLLPPSQPRLELIFHEAEFIVVYSLSMLEQGHS